MTDRQESADPQRRRRLSSAVTAGLIGLTLSLASGLQAVHSRGGLSAPPENGGDQDSYERLGFNLATGLGFGYCPSDAAILSGLDEPKSTQGGQPGCTPAEFSPTAYRPPGFPLLIAAVYRISPYNYRAVRLLNCFASALAVAAAAAVCATRFSMSVGVLAGVLCSVDPRYREFAGTFLTENLATLLLTLVIVLLTWLMEQPTPLRAAAAGLTFSALVLVRSFYVAWYPALALLAVALVRRRLPKSESGWWRRLLAPAMLMVCSLLLTAPWWIRNCLILQAVMPTGTQGGIGIADGFSDSAVTLHGSWSSATADGIAEAMRADPACRQMAPIEFEREHARRGATAARNWIREHPGLLPKLSWWKFSRLWELGSVKHGLLFGGMLLGMLLTRRTPLCRVMLVLLVLNSLTVVATYHTYERFLLPFRPMIHGMLAVAIVAAAQWLLSANHSHRSGPAIRNQVR